MDDLKQRILALELAAKHERELTDYRFADLYRRLQVLELSPFRALPVSSLIKLLIAILMPFLVLLATGDLGKAILAIRLAGGWPT